MKTVVCDDSREDRDALRALLEACGHNFEIREYGFGTLLTIDPDGSPVPTTISPSRNEGIRRITFCTGRDAPSPVRFDQNNKAAVCLNSPTYHISLTGTAQVCTDPETCREKWYEGLSNHFSGPDDPNLCVMRFTTQRYSLFAYSVGFTYRMEREERLNKFSDRAIYSTKSL